VEVTAIRLPRESGQFDLFKHLQLSAEFKDGDILVLSSKYVSVSEGALVRLSSVRPSAEAKLAASRYHMDPRLAELVLRESDYVFKGVAGFLLTIRDGMIAPNAGIDKSNAPHGFVILYPGDPFRSASNIRLKFLAELGVRLGVVIADSRLMPTRIGTTGVAIACSGFEPVEDQRGRKDLFGSVLRVTFKAVADSLATMGVAVMGESNESTPAALVRGADVTFSDREIGWQDMAVDASQDIYMRYEKPDKSKGKSKSKSRMKTI